MHELPNLRGTSPQFSSCSTFAAHRSSKIFCLTAISNWVLLVNSVSEALILAVSVFTCILSFRNLQVYHNVGLLITEYYGSYLQQTKLWIIMGYIAGGWVAKIVGSAIVFSDV